MFFKIIAKNPYRDLIRNARKVVVSDSEPRDKVNAMRALHALLNDKLLENERFLCSQPSFSKRCQHWNARAVGSIKPVNNARNPWLAFKREFNDAVSRSDNASYEETVTAVSRALGWFYARSHRDDWLSE